MGVAVDGELHAVPLGPQDVLIAQVEPVRVGVDLQGGAGARTGREDRVEVDVDGGALADEAGGGVADDVDVRVLAGLDDPPGQRLAPLVEVRVHRGHAQVEAGEELPRPVHLAVGADVQLRAVQHPHAAAPAAFAVLPVELADTFALGEDPFVGHPLHGHVGAVVGDRVIGVAALGGRGDHLLQRGEPVGEVGVGVQIAADVLLLDQVGQLAAQPGLDLAAVLAQGGCDPRQAEAGVDVLLGLGDDLLPGLGVEEPVLGELELLVDGHLPGADVVRLGTGEVLHGRAPGVGGTTRRSTWSPLSVRIDVFFSPCAMTSATYGSSVKARMTGAAFIAATRMSMSPIVSRTRRRDPA